MKDLNKDDNEDIFSKVLILKQIDQSKTIHEREICGEIDSLSESERNELFETLKRLYVDNIEKEL